MTRNASLDTNALLRLILNDIPEQRKKVIDLLNLPDIEYHVSDLVVAEIIFNLQTFGYTRKFISEKVQKLLAQPNINYNMPLFAQVFPYYVKHPALSFVDCYAAFDAEQANAEPLYTFDRKLANQHKCAKLI